MAGPAPAATNDARVRAFYLGLAGDQNATTVTPDALRRSADGLAGRPVDRTVDPVETEALLTIARQADLPEERVTQLGEALRTGSPLDIPRAAPTSGPNRFPSYLDLASLRSSASTCGCTAEAGTLVDRDGNQMNVIRGRNGLEARFARAGEKLDGKPTIQLNATERAAVAPHMVSAILRESQKAPESRTDWPSIMGRHVAPTGVPAGERDLSSLRDHTISSVADDGKQTLGYRFSDRSMAWIRYNSENPGQVRLAYSGEQYKEPDASAFRPMSRRETETFLASRAITPIYTDFWSRNFVTNSGFRSATQK